MAPEQRSGNKKRPISQYEHRDKDRANNPPVGLVTPGTDPDEGRATRWAFDPHLAPELRWDGGNAAQWDESSGAMYALRQDIASLREMAVKMGEYAPEEFVSRLKDLEGRADCIAGKTRPFLNWAGKAERMEFEVPDASLHVHERVDPATILQAARRRNGDGPHQESLFGEPEENPPLREALDFYGHRHGWSNRMIAGDSLLVMNSLLEREGMAGQVQMVYMDPPYGIKYGSNFQPFVNKRDVKDGADADLTREPEMIRAFRDTWELGLHSWLTYMRDRLLLSRELLHESGSCFVQISDENLHHVREIMDEVFGVDNFCGQILFLKTSGKGSGTIDSIGDYILWYSKNIKSIKNNKLFIERKKYTIDEQYRYIETENNNCRMLKTSDLKELDDNKKLKRFMPSSIYSDSGGKTTDYVYSYNGKKYQRLHGYFWRTNKGGMDKLVLANRIVPVGNYLRYKMFSDDYPVVRINSVWGDVRAGGFGQSKVYVVQTNTDVIQRCILMTTDPGDLVLDPTCGSGTTAFVAEQWGRRWITCDTSRVAITLAKQRLMTSLYPWYKLRWPKEGVSSGFEYETVPHITLKSIANNPEIRKGMTRVEIDAAIKKYADQETLYDRPKEDKSRARVTGPFTVEAVPAPSVRTPDDIAAVMGAEDAPQPPPRPGDASVSRMEPTARHADWRAELLKTGIRGKGGEHISFSRVEVLEGVRWLHGDGETKPDGSGTDSHTDYEAQRAVFCFGPDHAPMEQRQVEMALQEMGTLKPAPSMIVFAAFQFDPEAAKDIDETKYPGVTLLKAQMNADLLTGDLKKRQSSSQSFWLVGQPDVEVEEAATTADGEKQYKVVVRGFDYFNTKSGELESGGADKIAMWMLDTDYDGRSLFPRQVFFPMSGKKDGWSRLAKNLRAELDEEKMEAYRGNESLPFTAGENKQVAVKIVDDRGLESLRILPLDG